MAHTTAVLPIKANAPIGGSLSSAPTLILNDVDGDISTGDIIIFTGGKADVAADAAAAGTILGVATETNATAAANVMIALALPGVMFAGNTIEAADDQVGAYAQDIGVKCGLIAHSVTGVHAINIENTTQTVVIGLRYTRQSNVTQDSDPLLAGVGVTNPRIDFMFISGVLFDVA